MNEFIDILNPLGIIFEIVGFILLLSAFSKWIKNMISKIMGRWYEKNEHVQKIIEDTLRSTVKSRFKERFDEYYVKERQKILSIFAGGIINKKYGNIEKIDKIIDLIKIKFNTSDPDVIKLHFINEISKYPDVEIQIKNILSNLSNSEFDENKEMVYGKLFTESAKYDFEKNVKPKLETSGIILVIIGLVFQLLISL